MLFSKVFLVVVVLFKRILGVVVDFFVVVIIVDGERCAFLLAF